MTKLNLDRLSAMADTANQAGRWKARRDGLFDRGAPSNVRSLGRDVQARAEAEASGCRGALLSEATETLWRPM